MSKDSTMFNGNARLSNGTNHAMIVNLSFVSSLYSSILLTDSHFGNNSITSLSQLDFIGLTSLKTL